MNRKSLVSLIALVVATTIVGTAATAGARQGHPDHHLAGTWVVTVNRPAPLPPLTSLQVFTSDGSVVENANEASASRIESYGTWERVEGRLYAASAQFFRFNAAGAHVSTMKIDRNILLSPDGDSFTHAGRATSYDLDGNVIASFPVVASGERMQINHIPDQP